MNNKMEKCILVEYPGPLATITDTFKLMQRNKVIKIFRLGLFKF